MDAHSPPPSSPAPTLPPPPFASLRLASPADILRLGVVCTAGFRYSEEFTWERTHHEEYPQSTITFYRQEVSEFIRSPDHIVLVAMDRYSPEESSKTEAVIPADNGWSPPEPGTEVVVGLGIWKLEPSSERTGQFQNDNAPYPVLPPYDYKDLNRERADKFAAVAVAGEKKYFHGLSSMARIVVHPAYWRRGHGSAVARWGVALSEIDQLDQGVAATSMGAKLFKHVGYEWLTDLHVKGDDTNPEGVMFSLLKHKAMGGPKNKWCVMM